MKEFQVTCINKRDRLSSHEHITHIGNITAAKRWRLSREDAIRRIDTQKEAFYTIDRYSGNKIYVGVVREVGRNPFLRTYADGKWNDNLLALAECDGTCSLVS